ncbi:MAG: polysaccharide deacetylase family protein [Elusimicrobia bacterium]|nr:polysaccharide deacetylase family protein [Elusimicrobiota bacterium]
MTKRTAFAALAALALAGAAFAAGNPFAGKFFASGDPKKPEFALTFDDGPGYVTEDLLKLLAARGVKASFFMLGSSARAYPARARDVARAGHLVCSHTDTHKLWVRAARAADHEAVLEAELRRSAESIEKAAGVRPVILRMPNGYDRPWVRAVARRLGYTLVNWTYGSDWTKIPEARMTAEYVKAVRPGAILLMHDGGGKAHEKDLALVGAVLDEAARKGLKPVRLDELLGLAAPEAKR